MPGWLQPIAEHNPVSIVTDASRALYNGRDAGADPWIALAWAAGITLVFATLSIRKYRSATSR
jgi:ABC-2 type transport system permease protein